MTPKAVKMNITVPEDLRDEMNQASNVNWSAVACEAFRKKLTALELESNMSDLIGRLRAEKSQCRDEAYDDGHRWGSEWANEMASYPELKRLTKKCEELRYYTPENWEDIFTENAENPDPAMLLCEWIGGEDCNNWRSARSFWEDVGLEDPEEMENAWFKGFAEGAIEVFMKVRDEL